MKQVPSEVPQICSAVVQNLVYVLIGIWDLCTPDIFHILRFVELDILSQDSVDSIVTRLQAE